MADLWYAIVAGMLTVFVLLDGYDFGAACRECIVIKGDGFDLHTRNLMFKSNKLF